MNQENISEKVENVFKNNSSNKSNFRLNISANLAVMVAVFILIVLGAVSHTSNPGKYILSPITIVTVFAVFLTLSGVIKLNLVTLLIIIGLIILTMYQDDLSELKKEFEWDVHYIKDKLDDFLHIGAGNKEIRQRVIDKFHKKYAVKYSDTDYYVYIKQVDDEIKERVGHDTWTHNYFLVILPEVIDVDEGRPLSSDVDEKITLYAIDHVADLPIVVDYNVYTVKARAYLIRLGMFDGVSEILSWMRDKVLLPGDLTSFIETNILDYGKRVHGNKNYKEFVKKLEEHSYDLPDKLFIGG